MIEGFWLDKMILRELVRSACGGVGIVFELELAPPLRAGIGGIS